MKSRQTVRPAPARPAGRRVRLSGPQLDALVAEATVDTYNDDEQQSGLYTLIEDHLALPFSTEILGVAVSVKRVELTDDGIVALCVAGPPGRESPSSTCPCLPARPAAPSGSKPIGTGVEGARDDVEDHGLMDRNWR